MYYYIPDTPNGTTIKIYLNEDHEISVTDKFETVITNEVTKYIDNELFSEDVTEETKTNYFLLNSIVFKLLLNDDFGWKQLNKTDIKYLKVNKLKNYYKGNNPHTGKLNYDLGFSYMNYYGNLFNYSYDNDLFDYRRYVDTYYDELENIGEIGFKELINSGRTQTISKSFKDKYPLYADEKIHYFGNSYDIINIENPPTIYDIESATTWYDYNDYKNVLDLDLEDENTIKWLHGDAEELICSGAKIDGSTYQIVNTKVINIEFKLCGDNLLSKDCMEEIKYFQDVVIPYVSQMIPSTAIFGTSFRLKNEPEPPIKKIKYYYKLKSNCENNDVIFNYNDIDGNAKVEISKINNGECIVGVYSDGNIGKFTINGKPSDTFNLNVSPKTILFEKEGGNSNVNISYSVDIYSPTEPKNSQIGDENSNPTNFVTIDSSVSHTATIEMSEQCDWISYNLNNNICVVTASKNEVDERKCNLICSLKHDDNTLKTETINITQMV